MRSWILRSQEILQVVSRFNDRRQYCRRYHKNFDGAFDVLHMSSREGHLASPKHPYIPNVSLLFILLYYIPAVEGGALLHSGVLVALIGCTFDSNMAGEDGLAVMSLGLVNNITDLTFQNNSLFCTSGTYDLEEGSDEDEV